MSVDRISRKTKRQTSFAVLMAASLVVFVSTLFAPSAQAAPSCQDVFRKESGLALAAVTADEIDRLHRAWGRMELDRSEGREAHPEDLAVIMPIAERMLLSQGAKLQRIEFASGPAFEILPDPTGSGWNRMAASLKKNYGTRLLFAPADLARTGTVARFVHDSRSILISLESLWEGRGNSSVLHEARHAALFGRSHKSPTLFDAFIALFEPGPTDALSPGATEYRTFMDLSELATQAQDLVRAARAMMREDSAAIRNFAAKKLQDLRVCVANSYTFAKLLAGLTGELKKAPVVISGPVLRGDELDPNTAFVRLESGLEFHLRLRETGIADITILTERETAEVAVQKAELNPQLIAALIANDSRSQKVTQALLIEIFTSWSRDIYSLSHTAQIALPSKSLDPRSAPAHELERSLVEPWRAIAPFVRTTAQKKSSLHSELEEKP